MSIIPELPDEILIEALQAYGKMKERAAKNFTPTSAANAELNKMAATAYNTINKIKA